MIRSGAHMSASSKMRCTGSPVVRWYRASRKASMKRRSDAAVSNWERSRMALSRMPATVSPMIAPACGVIGKSAWIPPKITIS